MESTVSKAAATNAILFLLAVVMTHAVSGKFLLFLGELIGLDIESSNCPLTAARRCLSFS